jgi:hypothetical protein
MIHPTLFHPQQTQDDIQMGAMQQYSWLQSIRCALQIAQGEHETAGYCY